MISCFDESAIFEIVCSFATIALTDPRCLGREHRKDVPCHDAGLKAYDIPIIIRLVKKLHLVDVLINNIEMDDEVLSKIERKDGVYNCDPNYM